MAKEPSKNQPPYVSFGVFKTTIEQLAESTVPTGPLDRRVLDGLSGADHGALMSGLSFLGLVDDERKATDQYRNLIHAFKNTPKYKEDLYNIIVAKYGPIIGTLDLKTGTIAQLEKAFKDYGVAQGQMLTKTVRFFIKALQECGFQVSPHITKPKPRAPRSVAGKNGGDKQRIRGAQTERQPRQHDDGIPAGAGRMPIPGLVDAFIQYPMNLSEAQCDLFEGVVAVLRQYAKAHAGKGSK